MKRYINVSCESDWFFERDGQTYMATGMAEGRYEWYYDPGRDYMPNGDPGYPPEEDFICESFDCWVDDIYDTDGNCVDMELTDEEFALFEGFMQDELDEAAKNYDGEADI